MLYGNLTKDPELKALPSGIQVCNFSIATNRTWKDKDGNKQESADFHNVVIFGRQAETVHQYMRKGSALFIEGRIQTRSYDAKDGTKRYVTEVVAERTQFGPRSQRSDDAGTAQDPVDNPSDTPTEANIDDVPF